MNGFVYAIGGDDGLVKIGWSTNPVHRLAQINTARATPVQMLGLIPATRAQELAAHDLLSRWRVSGEWFRLEGPVRAFVEMLPKPKPKEVRMPSSAVAEALLTARRRLGENQTEFAKRFGVSQPVLCRWETGEHEPSAAVTLLIDKVLGDLALEAAE